MTKTLTLPLKQETDIVVIRQQVRKFAEEARLGLVSQTKIVTAASEIARNALIYGNGGECRLDLTHRDNRPAVRLIIADRGAGENEFGAEAGLEFGTGALDVFPNALADGAEAADADIDDGSAHEVMIYDL